MANTSTRHLIMKQIEQTIDVAAPPERVWALVSDLPRLSEWSPQVFKTFSRGTLQQGTQLFNINRRGILFWPTRSKIVRWDPGVEVAWKILENTSTWSFTLEPTATGTHLVHRRDAPSGLSEMSISLTDRFMGGQPAFQAELQQGMRQTLQRVKAAAER